ncbi:MAG: flagellar biosynthesis protein FlhF [Pseudomonadota bacterium]|nr:flagellar biosynthesis protein FlhF [Pseudomonadota bacterium]
MNIKRVFGKDMATAMQRVREQLGEDAVLLETRALNGGVEVVCSTEFEPEAGSISGARRTAGRPAQEAPDGAEDRLATGLGAALQRTRRQRQLVAAAADEHATTPWMKQRGDGQLKLGKNVIDSLLDQFGESEGNAHAQADLAPEVGADAAPAPDSLRVLETLRAEMRSMKELIDAHMRLAPVVASVRAPLVEALFQRLLALGISGDLGDDLLATLGPPHSLQPSWRALLRQLADRLPTLGGDLTADGGVFAFVGPTGAGKTTTIGKLAARYVLRHGADKVALVTIDCHRVAAHEQLRTFGRILGVPVRVADHTHNLPEVLSSLRSRELVLIDTAGFVGDDRALHGQLDQLAACGSRLSSQLLLPATSQRRVLEESLRTYQTSHLAGVVVTKVDEAACLGEVIDTLVQHGPTLTYVTDGQSIPDDIRVADADWLVARAEQLRQRDCGGSDRSSDAVPVSDGFQHA